MTITKKTRLLPLPFIGTRISIKLDDPESLTWGIRAPILAEGHDKAVIEWGDGTVSEVAAYGSQKHTYATTGEYEVRISDDLRTLQCSTYAASSVYRSIYAPMIRRFRTNAAFLNEIGTYCFDNAKTLSTFHCEGSGVRTIGTRAFGNCTSLIGRVDFPMVDKILQTAFVGCTGITELHFSEEKEAVIKASPEWEESGGKFGAENATVYFDL